MDRLFSEWAAAAAARGVASVHSLLGEVYKQHANRVYLHV